MYFSPYMLEIFPWRISVIQSIFSVPLFPLHLQHFARDLNNDYVFQILEFSRYYSMHYDSNMDSYIYMYELHFNKRINAVSHTASRNQERWKN